MRLKGIRGPFETPNHVWRLGDSLSDMSGQQIAWFLCFVLTVSPALYGEAPSGETSKGETSNGDVLSHRRPGGSIPTDRDTTPQ